MPTRLQPPANLAPEAARVFIRLVAATDPRHFRSADLEMLAAYCEAVAANEEAHRTMRRDGLVVGGKPSPWLRVAESSARTMQRLSVRLRLGPKGRLDDRQSTRTTAVKPSIFDLMGNGHGSG